LSRNYNGNNYHADDKLLEIQHKQQEELIAKIMLIALIKRQQKVLQKKERQTNKT
jgi:hypothetical protein